MAITVSQLNNYIKTLLESDIYLNQIAVRGEISNFKLHSSGHCYLTLKDENAVIKAVMFKTYASKLKFAPENGMKIIATGRISLYERDGQYQLYVSSMQPDGVGDLHIAYEQLKEKLQNEGIFDQKHKMPIPRFPKTVGVITSSTGAAIRDIINVSSRRFPLAEIIICPVLVQGDGSAEQISNAINYMNKTNGADVLIIGRGGGSIEDLWSFNEESVAYAIYNSKIPIISAVGHETDFTISDFVADLRAPTPSAAAELAVPSIVEIKSSISENYNRMLNAIIKNIEYKRSVISGFSIKNPIDFVNQNRLRSDNSTQKLINYANDLITKKAKQLAVFSASLDAMSPLKVLTRGYSVTKGKNGVIKSTDDVKAGDNVFVFLNDGSIDCTVNEVNKNG